MKTNKSYTKRIRVTKKGKLIARRPGQDHYNALDKGSVRMKKNSNQQLTVSNRIRRSFLSTISK